MISTCEPTEMPDGFTGVLLGLESFQDALVVLHGPTGCRGPHSALSERMLPRHDTRERMNYADRHFFGQPRIPTTHLDSHDIVFGAQEKLVKALRQMDAKATGPLALVNSPGAALIGDDLRACAEEAMPGRPCAVVEMPSLSRSFAEGYQQGVRAYLEAQPWTSQGVRPRTVALIGLSIAHAQWEGSVMELTRLLGLCGLDVTCSLGAGADVAACQALYESEVVAVVHPTYAEHLLVWLKKHLLGTCVTCTAGAPVGFAATEAWIREVTAAAGVDPTPALQDLMDHRRRVARMLNLASGSVESLRGSAFALKLDADLALPLARWLYEYLGLLPVAIQCPGDPAGHLVQWLEDIGCPEAWGCACEQSGADLLLADGPTCAMAQMHGLPAIPLTFPVDPVPTFLPDPILGVRGAVRLVEQVAKVLLG